MKNGVNSDISVVGVVAEVRQVVTEAGTVIPFPLIGLAGKLVMSGAP